MGALKMVRPHGAKTMDEAKAKVKHVLEEMKPTLNRFVKSTEWNKDETEARIKGKHVSGTFAVDESNLNINLKLSMAATLVKGKIESKIDSALKDHL